VDIDDAGTMADKEPPVANNRILLSMKKITFLAPSINPGNPGYRYRCLYPANELRKRGWKVDISTEIRTKGNRFIVVLSDIFISCSETKLTALIKSIELEKKNGSKIFASECDNLRFNPTNNKKLEDKTKNLDRLHALADLYIYTTETLADLAQKYHSSPKKIAVIPDGLETRSMLRPSGIFEKIKSIRNHQSRLDLIKLKIFIHLQKSKGITPLVWFGGHATARGSAGGMIDLLKIRNEIEKKNHSHKVSLTIISDNKSSFDENIANWSIPTHYLQWDRLNFHDALAQHEICLLPINSSAWTVCKSPNRIITALNVGLACISDEIPSYRAFAPVSKIGNWSAGLDHYLNTPSNREKDVSAARQLINNEWTQAKIADRWEFILNKNLN
jgi:hypothetical protein